MVHGPRNDIDKAAFPSPAGASPRLSSGWGRTVHELSFAESTLELALRHARKAGAGRVVGLHLVVGELTPLEPTSLDFYWERITKGTPADGSRVTVRRVPAQLACVDCGAAGET